MDFTDKITKLRKFILAFNVCAARGPGVGIGDSLKDILADVISDIFFKSNDDELSQDDSVLPRQLRD